MDRGTGQGRENREDRKSGRLIICHSSFPLSVCCHFGHLCIGILSLTFSLFVCLFICHFLFVYRFILLILCCSRIFSFNHVGRAGLAGRAGWTIAMDLALRSLSLFFPQHPPHNVRLPFFPVKATKAGNAVERPSRLFSVSQSDDDVYDE